MEQPSLDLFELLRIIVKNRIMIFVIVMLVALAAVIYSLVTPQIWASEATFFAVGENISELPFNIPGFSSISASLLGTDSGDQAVNFITVMQSRSFSETVIRKFNLIPYFKLHNADSLRNMDDALKKLSNRMISIGVDDNSGLISIKASTKNKQLSLDIVNHYLARLDDYNRKQKITHGRLNREFLEQRVNETRTILDSLIAVNRKFQEQNKTIDLESQSKSMIDSYAALVTEKMKLDIELEIAKSTYGTGNPILRELELKKIAIQNQIKALENSDKSPKPVYLLDIDKIPQISSQYALIKMNLDIYKAVFEFLYPQFEAARLSELKDMPTIEVLDQPRLAGRRDKPKRAIICFISTLLGFILAFSIALLKELLYRSKTHPNLLIE